MTATLALKILGVQIERLIAIFLRAIHNQSSNFKFSKFQCSTGNSIVTVVPTPF